MTAQLSCHVQKFILISWSELGWEKIDFTLNLNYDVKIVSKMGPWLYITWENPMGNLSASLLPCVLNIGYWQNK